MGNAIAQGQFANEQPPVQGRIMAITLDAASREKDLGALALGGAGVDNGGEMFLTLRADVRFFFFFSDVSGKTVNEAAADAAVASPITFGATYCADAAANEKVRVRIDRKRHRYLVVKGSGAGTLRMWVSSEPSTR